MRNVVSKPYALLFVMAAACLTFSCSKHEPVLASNAKAADVPTVAVAKVSTEDLSHGLVLTAEFKPFQEVDVMAKVAGFVKQINVDVGDRVKQGGLDAIQARHADIHDHDVRFQLPGHGHSFTPIIGFSDNREVGLPEPRHLDRRRSAQRNAAQPGRSSVWRAKVRTARAYAPPAHE